MEEEAANVQVAGFWRRVLATLFDAVFLVICLATFLAIRFGLFLEAFMKPIEDATPALFYAELKHHAVRDGAAVAGFFFFYFFLLEYLFLRGTLGKMVLGIRISHRDGSRPGFLQSIIRCFGKFFFGATTLGLSWGCALLSRKRQAWHDRLAKTIVVLSDLPSAPEDSANSHLHEDVSTG